MMKLLFCLLIAFSKISSDDLVGKTFEDLLKEKKIINQIPNYLYGIWYGKVIFVSDGQYDGDEIVFNMCEYPIREIYKKKISPHDNFRVIEYLKVITTIKKNYYQHRKKSFFDINLRGFTNSKLTGGFNVYRYDPIKKVILDERFGDGKLAYWIMEFKKVDCSKTETF